MKKSLFPLLIAITFLWLFPFSDSYGQTDIKKQLLNNVVTIANGNYSIKEYGLITTFDEDFEVMLTATAPQSLISRDNFLRIFGALSSSIFVTYLQQEGKKVPDDLVLVKREAPAAEIKITANITMDDKGVHYSVGKAGSTNKMTLNWNQLYVDRN